MLILAQPVPGNPALTCTLGLFLLPLLLLLAGLLALGLIGVE